MKLFENADEQGRERTEFLNLVIESLPHPSILTKVLVNDFGVDNSS